MWVGVSLVSVLWVLRPPIISIIQPLIEYNVGSFYNHRPEILNHKHTDILLGALKSATHITNLRRISICSKSILTTGVSALCELIEQPHMKSLRCFTIGRASQTQGFVNLMNSLERSTHLSNLKQLGIRRCPLDHTGITALGNCLSRSPHLRGITKLHLRRSWLGDKGAIALTVDVLGHLPKLTVLGIESTHIGNSGAITITNTVIPQCITYMAYSHIDTECATTIADIIIKRPDVYVYTSYKIVNLAMERREYLYQCAWRMTALFSVIQLQPPNFLLDYNAFRIVQPFLV